VSKHVLNVEVADALYTFVRNPLKPKGEESVYRDWEVVLFIEDFKGFMIELWVTSKGHENRWTLVETLGSDAELKNQLPDFRCKLS
jgi:hypothetical protein